MKRIVPPIKRAGGKSRLLKDILPLIEKAGKHACYAECFGGGLAVLLNKPRSQVEVINDIDGDLVNFHRQCQAHAPEIQRLMRHQLNSRVLFNEAKQSPPGETDVQRAVRYWFKSLVSFGRDGSSFGVMKTGGSGAGTRRRNQFRALRAAARRLDGVIVECLDWQRLFKNYDGPQTLWFLDPPYVGGSQKSYSPWTLETMRTFRDAVFALQGRCIVTVGDTPEMRALWKPWKMRGITRILNIRTRGKAFGELIICSYAQP